MYVEDADSAKRNAELEAIKYALKEAEKYSLQVEVVYFALRYIKESGCSIEQAINHGLNEWVK